MYTALAGTKVKKLCNFIQHSERLTLDQSAIYYIILYYIMLYYIILLHKLFYFDFKNNWGMYLTFYDKWTQTY